MLEAPRERLAWALLLLCEPPERPPPDFDPLLGEMLWLPILSPPELGVPRPCFEALAPVLLPALEAWLVLALAPVLLLPEPLFDVWFTPAAVLDPLRLLVPALGPFADELPYLFAVALSL